MKFGRKLPLLLFLLFATEVHGDEDRAKPNVLMICLDDLNDWAGTLTNPLPSRKPPIPKNFSVEL